MENSRESPAILDGGIGVGCGRESEHLRSEYVAEVFLELFTLLEEYAPAWYTEEHRKRGLTALEFLQKS